MTIALTSTSTSSRILPSDPKQVHPISYCLFENVPETREQRSWVETSRSRAIPRGTGEGRADVRGGADGRADDGEVVRN